VPGEESVEYGCGHQRDKRDYKQDVGKRGNRPLLASANRADGQQGEAGRNNSEDTNFWQGVSIIWVQFV